MSADEPDSERRQRLKERAQANDDLALVCRAWLDLENTEGN